MKYKLQCASFRQSTIQVKTDELACEMVILNIKGVLVVQQRVHKPLYNLQQVGIT